MNAVTALRPGRQRALVQRPRRKAHLASIAAGDTTWVSFCDRDIETDGALFWVDDAEQYADTHPDEICAYCTRFILLTRLLFQEYGIETQKVAR